MAWEAVLGDKLDVQSETWRALRRMIEQEIEVRRDALEADVGVEKTAALRGGIAALRGILESVELPELDILQDAYC